MMSNDHELLIYLRETLRSYVVASGRMVDRWADGDETVKQELWRGLHELYHGASDLLDEADGAHKR